MDDSDWLARAKGVLETAPLFDGHNDLPYVIRADKQARGDVFAYDLNRERGDTDIARLRDGRVGGQFWSAFQPTHAPHPARTALELIDTIPHAAQTTSSAPARRAKSRPISWSKGESGSKTLWGRCASGTRRARAC